MLVPMVPTDPVQPRQQANALIRAGFTRRNATQLVEAGATGMEVQSPNVQSILVLTQAEYDGLEAADPNTLYLVVG